VPERFLVYPENSIEVTFTCFLEVDKPAPKPKEQELPVEQLPVEMPVNTEVPEITQVTQVTQVEQIDEYDDLEIHLISILMMKILLQKHGCNSRKNNNPQSQRAEYL
jgi:hypothetical protein